MDLVSVLIAATGVSFALTSLTVLSVRSENDKRLVIATFVWTIAAVTGIFYWAELPADLSWLIGGVSAAVGALCLAILLVARHIERRYRAS